MGSYTFKWESREAKEVYVTGTFDDWKKTVKLDGKDGKFEKTVDLSTDTKILYKFFVDGNWCLDPSKPSETDSASIANNVLFPSDIQPHPTSHMMSNVTPDSTTAKLAGQVPKEAPRDENSGAPSETPAADFKVNPIPATPGIGNPVKLEPGQKVPDPKDITSNTVESTVKLDKGSYENADAAVASPPDKKPEGDMFSVPPVTKDTIPESSLPMNADVPKDLNAGPFISSAAPQSTTAQLAGQVPIEPRGVPQVVSESQEAAKASPEAAANAEAVAEKKEVEAELKSKVPEVPSGGEASKAVAEGVPNVVSESVKKAEVSPEAAANPAAVADKKEVEEEIKKEAKKDEAAGPATPAKDAAKDAETPESKKEAKKKNRRSRLMNKLKKIF